MKHTALLVTLLASLPLGACAMAPLDADGTGDEHTGSKSENLLWYVSNPDPTVIDFDRTPAQAAIADGSSVDSTYTSLGVTFSCTSCATAHAFARLPGKVGNGVSAVASPVFAPFDSHAGGVRADFTTPRSWVSVDVLAVMAEEHLGISTAKPWFEAFNAAGQLIGSVLYYPAQGAPGFGQWQTLRIDDATGSIKFVIFSSQHGSPQVFGEFDNLSFNTDPYWVEATPLPKPPPIFRAILLPPPNRPFNP